MMLLIGPSGRGKTMPAIRLPAEDKVGTNPAGTRTRMTDLTWAERGSGPGGSRSGIGLGAGGLAGPGERRSREAMESVTMPGP
jgi:hypothetical protein